MKRILLPLALLIASSTAFSAIDKKFNEESYEFKSLEINSSEKEHSISLFRDNSLMFLKENTVYTGSIDTAATGLNNVAESKALTDLGIHGTVAYDAAKNKIYFTIKESEDCEWLYESTFDGEKWSKPKRLVIEGLEKERGRSYFLANAGWNYAKKPKLVMLNPTIAKSGNRIYFTSADIEGGKGGKDIWWIEPRDESKWQYPVNAGETINTEEDEDFAFVENDEILYVSRTKAGVGTDVFKADANGNTWADAEIMNNPYNGLSEDYNIVVKDGTPFMISNRGGSHDIWAWVKLPEPEPEPEIIIPELEPIVITFPWAFYLFDFDKSNLTERFLREIFGIVSEEGSEEAELDIREGESETEEEKTDLRFLKLLFSMTGRIRDLLSEEPMTMQAFVEMMNAGLSEMKAGRIPSTLDCVTVGDLKRSRLDGIRWLYLVGANEGKIPSAVTGGGIFTDTERRELMASDLEMAPDDRRDASVQEYYLYLIENKPKNGLIITYPFADRDGKGLRRSSHVKEKGERIPYGEKKFRERKQSKDSDITETISKETASFVYDNTLHGSVTSAETYRKCPFAYFANYGLHLMERKNRDIEAVDMGKVYHAALDSAVRRLQEEKKELAKVSDTELDILADSVVGRAVSDYSGSLFLSDARSRYLSKEILMTVRRTLKNLAAQQRAGSFAVCATEKKFAVREPGLELTGIIDRIDTAQSADGTRTFVNVIDYKSGSREADLARMMDGLDMQLATYLTEAVRLVEESGKLPGTVQPAGMYYYHVSDPIVKEGEDAALKMAMNGVTAQEEEVLAATDRELLSSGEKSPVNGLKYDGKKGKITGGTVLAPELLEGLLSHTREVMKEDAKKILAGDIRVYPYRYGESTGCDYCRFAAVCGMDRRSGKKMRRVEKADLSKIGENID